MDDYGFILKEDFSKFSGEWVAVSGANIVANGKNIKKVIKKAKKVKPREVPFVFRVPGKETMIL